MSQLSHTLEAIKDYVRRNNTGRKYCSFIVLELVNASTSQGQSSRGFTSEWPSGRGSNRDNVHFLLLSIISVSFRVCHRRLL